MQESNDIARLVESGCSLVVCFYNLKFEPSKPIVKILQEVKEKSNLSIVMIQIDESQLLDYEDMEDIKRLPLAEIVEKYQVEGIPTVVGFHAGRETWRLAGRTVSGLSKHLDEMQKVEKQAEKKSE